MGEKPNWQEWTKEYKEKTKILKGMPVDELLEHMGFHCDSPNRLEEASSVNNPELDKAIINQHIINEAVA